MLRVTLLKSSTSKSVPCCNADKISGFFGYYLLESQQNATEIAAKLLEKGLATVPFINPKNGPNGIWVAFCSISEEKLPKAVKILFSVE